MSDAEETSLAAVTDDSCRLHYIEIVPLDRASDDYCKQEFIERVVEVKPEDLQDVKHRHSEEYCKQEFIEPVKPKDLQDMKQDPADDNDTEDSHYFIKVIFQLANCFNY